MSETKRIQTALISVFHKDGLDELLSLLNASGVKFISTGGTKSFIESQGYKCEAVEDLTGYPSILGGRVKTLHPQVMGGILRRRDVASDCEESSKYSIPEIDLVIVDLYPFQQTVASGASEADIIEKIDIGGISLIRAAAKNFKDVVIVASKAQYSILAEMLKSHNCAESTLEERKILAREAFAVSSGYDSAIFNYFDTDSSETASALRYSLDGKHSLRYGENPHQQGAFIGPLDDMFTQLHGKEISYNNLLDIDAAVGLINEFTNTTFAILKHSNACGIAVRDTVLEAWTDALACDPISAFGGVLICNREIDEATAEEINKIFFEVVVAPSYTDKALEILKSKKNRIILLSKDTTLPAMQVRSILNGALVQQRDTVAETEENLKVVTKLAPSKQEVDDLLIANRIVKHSKSNAIVLVKNRQLCASGVGQTSRVDSLKQAVEKAHSFGFDLNGAVMASDAFFPFPDCVEIAAKAGIKSVIHPGGSIRDNESIEFCDRNGLSMVITGLRHFRH